MDDGIAVGMIMTIFLMIAGTVFAWGFDALRPAFSILLMTIWVVGLSVWFRRMTSNWHRRDRRKMVRLMDRLEERIGEMSAAPALPQLTSSEETLEQRLHTNP